MIWTVSVAACMQAMKVLAMSLLLQLVYTVVHIYTVVQHSMGSYGL